MAIGKRILFVCTHNSARSQMAEAYLRQMAADRFEVESAGLEPRELNPLAVEVMAEDGMDISGKKAQSVFDLYKAGRIYTHVITVCESQYEDQCPIFPGITKRLHIPFDDPAQLGGSREDRLAGTRRIRDQIKKTVAELVEEL